MQGQNICKISFQLYRRKLLKFRDHTNIYEIGQTENLLEMVSKGQQYYLFF